MVGEKSYESSFCDGWGWEEKGAGCVFVRKVCNKYSVLLFFITAIRPHYTTTLAVKRKPR